MSVNNYDLLNVDESATADEIRAAWKTAIADLDPSDRRFRAYNDAAGVLLDEDKRASYDAGLAEARVEAEPEADPAAESAAESAAEPEAEAEPAPEASTPSTPSGPSEGPRKSTLIGLGVAAALAVVLAIATFTLPGVRADESPKDVAERSEAQARATLAVESAAEQMVTPVLSYNHKTMDEDLERLKGFLTSKMAGKQSAAWPELTKEAQTQQIVVEATPTGTALTRVDPDGKRATVVVFIDQYVEKKATEPFVLHMWATMSLVREGGTDGRWLLDDLCTDDSCG